MVTIRILLVLQHCQNTRPHRGRCAAAGVRVVRERKALEKAGKHWGCARRGWPVGAVEQDDWFIADYVVAVIRF